MIGAMPDVQHQQARLEEAFDRIEETILPCIAMMLDTLLDASANLAELDPKVLIAELQTLAKEYPNHATVETQAGILTALKGDYPGAERRLSQALALDQNSLEALNALVSLDLSQKNTASAAR